MTDLDLSCSSSSNKEEEESSDNNEDVDSDDGLDLLHVIKVNKSMIKPCSRAPQSA